MVAEGVVGGYFRPRRERVHAPGLPGRDGETAAGTGGNRDGQQRPSGPLPGHPVARGDSEKARFAREYVTNLVGADSAVTFFMQPSNLDPSCRITISVPRRMAEAVRRIEETGLQPVFREPEAPHVDGNSCVLPGSFQVRRFGVTIDPRSVSDHPQRQGIIADTLVQHIPDLPEEARDFLSWTRIDADEETGAVTIHWE